MDFTSQYQFAGGQPYHHHHHHAFMAIPSLTPPSNSHSATSDEFSTTSPPDAFEPVHNSNPEQFRGFDYNPTFHNPSQHQQAPPPPPPPPNFPGPPTPPNHPNHPTNPAQFTTQPPGHGAQQGAHIHHQASVASALVNGSAVGLVEAEIGAGVEDPNQLRGGSDDDESLTPAQSRRKAQNRAAQRAFRERKEKHVKDLEAKLADMEAARRQASVENERLKRDLHKMSTENEILRATSSASNGHNGSRSPEPTTTGPMRYNPTDFYSNVLQNHQNKFPSHRIVTSDDGERLLAAGATWDFIINHHLYKKGLVDVEDVSERLKTCARCDGQGPVFSEQDIIRAMEQSVASGSDDLL